ncbi:MAG: hypothetical protein MZV65_43975 [Chromatiales bacterium]|nr:hypothetical protein [Chromatiales bacterium]
MLRRACSGFVDGPHRARIRRCRRPTSPLRKLAALEAAVAPRRAEQPQLARFDRRRTRTCGRPRPCSTGCAILRSVAGRARARRTAGRRPSRCCARG